MAAVLPREGLDKLEVLANFVSPAIFQIWSSRWNITSSFCEAKKRDFFPVLFLTHGTGSLIWTLDDSAPSSLFGNSQQGLLFPKRHSCTISRREYTGCCYYWLTVSFNPPEIIGEIWRPCSKLSDLNRIQFLHHRRTQHSIAPLPSRQSRTSQIPTR